jgi:putative colanic acid biosynthesis acetyltransferase WcaF
MKQQVALSSYKADRPGGGASLVRMALWYGIGYLIVRSHFLVSSSIRAAILRAFGATIGESVVLKPGIRVKYPWKLSIGSYSWIGESVWLDTVEAISIGDNVCISQGAYLCTGNHDWTSPAFDLRAAPIIVESQAWVAARACVGPGVVVGAGSVLTLGSVATSDLQAFHIYSGNPAVPIAQRTLRED